MGARNALEQLFNHKVDLVGLEGIKKKPHFAENVHNEKVLLYAASYQYLAERFAHSCRG